MKELVVDASVVLKWYLTDERYGPRALSLLEQHVAGEISLCAPGILPYEVLNALIVAERMKRIPREVTDDAFDGFLDLDITLVDPFSNYSHVMSIARTFGRSVYDASYLSLAGARDINLVTGDRRLYNAVKRKLKWVKWIGEVDTTS